MNGNELAVSAKPDGGSSFGIKSEFINKDDANLLVIRVNEKESGDHQLSRISLYGMTVLSLEGRWEARLGDDSSWSNIPLPAKFGASPNVFFEPAR